MRLGFAMAMSLTLSACATRDVKPSEAEMDRVETALRANPCVDDVNQWSRNYFYHAKYFGEEVETAATEQRAPRASGHVRTQISFALQQKLGAQKSAGRTSLAAPPVSEKDAGGGDGASLRRAFGSYDLRNGTLHIARCDPSAL